MQIPAKFFRRTFIKYLIEEIQVPVMEREPTILAQAYRMAVKFENVRTTACRTTNLGFLSTSGVTATADYSASMWSVLK